MTLELLCSILFSLTIISWWIVAIFHRLTVKTDKRYNKRPSSDLLDSRYKYEDYTEIAFWGSFTVTCFFIVSLLMALVSWGTTSTARHHCEQIGRETQREVRFIRQNGFVHDCLVKTENGQWRTFEELRTQEEN